MTPTPTPTPEQTPAPTPTPESTPIATTTSELTLIATTTLEIPVHFPQARSRYTYNHGKDIGAETLPEAAGGAGGFTYSLTPSLPSGLSFDSTTRALTGTPAEFGSRSMTYTATDASGAQASVSFTIDILGTALSSVPPSVRNLTVARTRFATSSNPAIDVTFDPPNMSGDQDVVEYELRYLRANHGVVKSGIILGKNDRSYTITNLVAGATYRVDVRAKFTDIGWNPNFAVSQDITTNRPPQQTNAFYPDADFPVGVYYYDSDPLSRLFTDPDGDTLTYSASVQYPSIASSIIVDSVCGGCQGTGPRGQTLFYNPASTELTYGAYDGYGGYVSRTAIGTGKQGATLSIAEHSPAGTVVGSVTGNPYNGETFTYTLHGEAATSSAFVINSATGQISVKQGATLDYETKSSYTGQVKWTVQGQQAVANLTINVEDLEADKPDAPTVTRAEFASSSNPALDVAWTAPDANDLTISWYQLQYRKKAAEGEEAAEWTLFNDHVLESAGLRLFGLEPGATYEFQVQAGTNEEGLGPWSDTGSGQVNRPPTASSVPFNGGAFPMGSIADYKETGQGALGAFFEDADGDTLTYSASAEHPELLGVSLSGSPGSASLKITLLNPGSSGVIFTAKDPYGGQVSRTVNITATANVSRIVFENSPAGTNVGAPVTGTPHDGETLSYTLAGEATNAFAIATSTGQISVKQGATLDYDTKNSYTGRVEYTVDGDEAVIHLTILVMKTGAAKPGAPTLTRTRFSQQSNPALDVTWTAPATSDGATITGYKARYREAPDEIWTAYTGALSATSTSLNLPNLEAGATYEAQVLAVTQEEGDGPWSNIGSGRANRQPTATSALFNGGAFPVGSIADYKEAGQGALGVFFQDADRDALTYSASAQHPALLGVSLSGAAGQAHLKVTLLNPGASEVTLVATDPYGGQVSRSVTLTASPKRVSLSIAENSLPAHLWATR